MATENSSTWSSDASASSSSNPISPSPTVPKEGLKQTQKVLYTDFTNDNPTAEIQPAPIQQIQGSNSSEDRETAKTKVPPDRYHPINFDESRPYYCHVCKLDSSSMEEFMKHSICIYHIKNTAELFNYKVRTEKDKEEKKEKPSFHCQSCQITCNSPDSWNAHLIGQKHRKILEKQGAERAMQKILEKQPPPLMAYNQGQGIARGGRGVSSGVMGIARGGRGVSRGGGGPILGGSHLAQVHGRKPYEKPVHTVRQPSQSGPIGAKDFAQYPEPLIGLEYVTEIQVIGQSPRYHCELCDSKFDHNLKFPHLVGAKHRLNVLKEKNPNIASELRNGTKKRSELTGRLLEEAQKLENQVGRQQVKTRVEKSPFAAVNEEFASGRGTHLANSRGNFSGSRGVVRGAGFLGRGAASPSRGMTRGVSRGTTLGSRGVARGTGVRGRGATSATRGSPYAQHFVSPRGRGRAHSAGQGSTNWGQQQPVGGAAGFQASYSGGHQQGYDQSQQGPPMLPPAAFQKRSPPRSSPTPAYPTPPSTGQQPLQPYSQQTQPFPGGPTPQQQQINTNQMAYNYETENSQPPASAESKQAASSLLQGLGDLSKLVNTEEEASVALQVSNALTHALLTFRMQQMPEGEGGASSSGP